MPLPYSVDLRERVLSAHEHGEGNAAARAAQFRVAVTEFSTKLTRPVAACNVT